MAWESQKENETEKSHSYNKKVHNELIPETAVTSHSDGRYINFIYYTTAINSYIEFLKTPHGSSIA